MTVPADTWAALRPTGSAPKPINRPISNAPRPPTPISGHGHVLPTEPAAAYAPPVVPGFVAFPDIPWMLAASAEGWKAPIERMPAKANLPGHAEPIARYLAVTNNQAAGILKHDGGLRWAPGATWRIPCFVDGKEVHAALAAMHGKTIPFPGKHGRLNCDPILSCRALALSFGAKNPPEAPPQSVLSGIREIDPPENLPAARPAAAKLPPFDSKRAKALLAAEKVGGLWRENAPTEGESKEFLRKHFAGIPNEPHRKVLRELWPDVRRGPRPKRKAAE